VLFSERSVWSGLLVALLLVTPGHFPARPGVPTDSSETSSASVFDNYGGITAVDGNLGGALVVEVLDLTDAQWGNDVSM
jgi:hypothetical protein